MWKAIQRTLDFALFICFGSIGMVGLVKLLNSNIDPLSILFIVLILMASGRCLEDFIINIVKELKNTK